LILLQAVLFQPFTLCQSNEGEWQGCCVVPAALGMRPDCLITSGAIQGTDPVMTLNESSREDDWMPCSCLLHPKSASLAMPLSVTYSRGGGGRD
jgi:hypothetical protein